MTAVAQSGERAFSDRSPIARTYRRFLAKSMLLMFALILIGAYLLPLLYMVTTAFQQPGQSTVPGAPVWPAEPQTATYQGQGSRSIEAEPAPAADPAQMDRGERRP